MVKNTLLSRAKRSTYALWAVVLFAAIMIPGLQASKTQAYGLLGARNIKMGNSSVGTLTAGQNVIYQLNFNIVTAGNIGSIRIQFCNNSPIINDSLGCDAIPGFNTNHTTITTGTQTGVTGWSVSPVNSDAATLVLSQVSAVNITGPSLPQAVSITLGDGTAGNGFTNPSNVQTFFARIMTYASTDGTGTEVDAGGVALATTVSLDITSIVKERLTFCVYRGATCAASGATPNNTFALGNAQGVLDTIGPYVDRETKYDVASNAVGRVAVRIKGPTLTSGANTIQEIGATPAVSVNNTEQFGFCSFMNGGSTGINIEDIYDGGGGAGPTTGTECAGTTDTSGNTAPGGANGAEFAFDTNTTSGTMSPYGSQFAVVDPGQTATGTLAFVGNVRDTTEAGIYRTTLNLIATGTY